MHESFGNVNNGAAAFATVESGSGETEREREIGRAKRARQCCQTTPLQRMLKATKGRKMLGSLFFILVFYSCSKRRRQRRQRL